MPETNAACKVLITMSRPQEGHPFEMQGDTPRARNDLHLSANRSFGPNLTYLQGLFTLLA